MPGPAPHAERLRSLRRLALLVVVVDVVIAVVMAQGRPARPAITAQTLPPPTTATTAPPAPPAPSGQGVVVRIERPGQPARTRCFLTTSLRAARPALRHSATFAPYAGVAVEQPDPTTTGVTAAGAVVPLIVAYFDDEGRFVSSAVLVPCPATQACPTAPPAGPYRLALQAPTPTSTDLGLAAGTTAQAVGAC